MSTAPQIRVSDQERQAAADSLKAALEEGRLDFAEYDRRLGLAYGSTTDADLARAVQRRPDALATEFAGR
jgi:ribosomal protein L9